MEPLVTCEDLRVDVDDVPACDGLTLRTTGERVLVLGAPRAIFEAASGLRPAARGRITVRGAAPAQAVADRAVAAAPLDPPLPPKWTPLEYATWSARLSGHGVAEAALRAKQAIDELELTPLARTPTARIAPHARRAAVVAAAMATGAPVILVEDPLAGLAEEVSRAWARMLVAALERRAWAVFAPRVPLTSPLAMNAEEALVIGGARVEIQGAPAELAAAERRFVARLHGPLEALAPRLASRGARVDASGRGDAHVVIELGASLTTSELLGICQDVEVTIVELLPSARALT